MREQTLHGVFMIFGTCGVSDNYRGTAIPDLEHTDPFER